MTCCIPNVGRSDCFSEVVVSSSSEAMRVRVMSFFSSKFVVLFGDMYDAHMRVPAQSSDLFEKKELAAPSAKQAAHYPLGYLDDQD